MRRILAVIFAVAMALSAGTAWAKTELTFYGHAAFKITTPSGKVILIDPWIANVSNPNGKADLAALDKVDLILLTHGHVDHVGEAAAIAKRTGAKLVANIDLAHAMVEWQNYPKDQIGWDYFGGPGGQATYLDGEVRILITPAVHSSTVREYEVMGEHLSHTPKLHQGGAPVGFVVYVKDGPSIYHTGDTGLFSDMALLPKWGKIDVFLPYIADRYGMGPMAAAEAAVMVDASLVIPQHHNRDGVASVTGLPEHLKEEMDKRGIGDRMKEMQAGETITFP